MPHFIKIDDPEDYAWLKRMTQKWLSECQSNISAYVDVIDRYQRLSDSFEHAVDAPYVTVPQSQAVEKKTKTTPKEKEPIHQYKLCGEHPTYSARRSPRTTCDGCWSAYEKMNPMRGRSAREKFFRKAGA